jgi:hypothetical protein
MYFLVLRRHLNPSLSEHETFNWNMPETPKTIVHSQKSSCLEYVLDPEVTDLTDLKIWLFRRRMHTRFSYPAKLGWGFWGLGILEILARNS